MKKERGIPKDILRELDIKEQEISSPIEVTAVVEAHQIKLPIPIEIRLELDIKKGQKLKVIYDKEKKEIIYKL